MPDRVGVVCVTYNSSAHLADTLAGLASLPVIVIDNHSSDRSAEIARGYGASVTVLPHNIGFGRANNLGVELLPADIRTVAFVNPDLRIGPSELRRLADVLDRNPDIGVVAPRLVFPDGTPQMSGRAFPSLRRLSQRALAGFRVAATSSDSDPRPDWVIGAAMLVRRAEFVELGAFDPRFFLYYEDADLCARYRECALSVAVHPDILATHHYHRESRRKLDLRNRVVRLHWQAITKLALKYPRDFLR